MGGMTHEELTQLLEHGKIDLQGQIEWGSNATLLVQVEKDDRKTLAIYKPRRGETPLWDFPRGTLCQRERAAYLVSSALGWNLVPLTLMRKGPFGIGSLQAFIEHDPNWHYFHIERNEAFRQSLQRFVLFDYIINNADRKGGHLLLDEAGVLWGIDHGLCFHTEFKLRTVIWEFAGQSIEAQALESLRLLSLDLKQGTLGEALKGLISADEKEAFYQRIQRLLTTGTFPDPGPRRHYPWPPI